MRGTRRLYNVASGRNVFNAQLLERLLGTTQSIYSVEPDPPTIVYLPINMARVSQEFQFVPSNVLDDLPRLVEAYRRKISMDHYAN